MVILKCYLAWGPKRRNSYLIAMGSVLMLSTVAGVGEGFRTSRVLACVGLLSRVASEMSLKVF
jgi:hypothetical protein